MHGRAHKTMGLTLIEMTLVIGTIVLLVGLAVPAVRSLTHSFHSQGAVKSMIDGALSSARVMAMTRQRYVGVRFQKACVSDDPANPLQGLLNASQYMIFIMSEEPQKIGGLGDGFRVVDGLEPIKLPDSVGVMALDEAGALLGDLSRVMDSALSDATTFSIVFAPSGRLVVHDVRVRNRQGVYQPKNDGSKEASRDEVFNSVDNICLYREGRFIQDDYSQSKNATTTKETVELGLGEERSVTSFMVYDTSTLRALFVPGTPRNDILSVFGTYAADQIVHVNWYTGHLIASD